MAIWRTLSRTLPLGMAGWPMATGGRWDRGCGWAGFAGGFQSADTTAVGQDIGDRGRDSDADQDSVWHSAGDLHVVGVGSRGLGPRVRLDCRPQLRLRVYLAVDGLVVD